MIQAAVHSFSALTGVRFLLGAFEAGVSLSVSTLPSDHSRHPLAIPRDRLFSYFLVSTE